MTFKKMLQQTDKIIFGHPGIGKSFYRLTNFNIIVPDDDYKLEHLEHQYLRKHSVYQTWKNYVTDWWNTIKLDAKRDDKQIFVSNLFVLQMFPNDLDRVINLLYGTFIERMKCRGHYCEGRTEAWKTAINKAICKIPQYKVFSTDKYLSDILNNY